ncbi:MAG: PEGA domain-containing protein [Deltaproteobacteria bacterium]|nr:PEGA domain-containing protein [Deltaproteobacteria bacterium]
MRFKTFPALMLAFLLVPITAGAQEAPPRTKVLPLRVSSNRLGTEDLKALTDAVTAKLAKYPTYEVMPVPADDPMDMLVDAGCVELDAECLSTIGAAKGADRVLYTEVSEKDGRFQVLLRFVDVKTKEARSPEGGVETREKLGDFVALALEKVLGPEPVKEPVLAKVDIETQPVGAEVYLNRDFVGLTPVSLRLKDGTYDVRISKVGYRDETFPVQVEEGRPASKTVALAVVTVPVAPTPARPEPRREVASTPFYKTWWFWTAVGAAVVGAGTTAYLLTRPGGSGTVGSGSFTADPAQAQLDVLLRQ